MNNDSEIDVLIICLQTNEKGKCVKTEILVDTGLVTKRFIVIIVVGSPWRRLEVTTHSTPPAKKNEGSRRNYTFKREFEQVSFIQSDMALPLPLEFGKKLVSIIGEGDTQKGDKRHCSEM